MTPLSLCHVAAFPLTRLTDAIGQTPIPGGEWVAVGLCALAAVSLLILIAAIIPGKRK